MPSQQKLGTISVGLVTEPTVAIQSLATAVSALTVKSNEHTHLLFAHDASGKGGVSNAVDPRYTMPINLGDPGISSLDTGIDGTSLYTYSASDYTSLHPVFYQIDIGSLSRPNTIYETFLAVIEWTEAAISAVSSSVTVTEGCITDCNYTTNFIGEIAFDALGVLTPGSLAESRVIHDCYLEQLRLEVLGDTFAYKSVGDCTTTDDCSLSEKVDALLMLHGGAAHVAGWTNGGACTVAADLVADDVGCPAKYVDSLYITQAERLYRQVDDSIALLPDNQYTAVSTAFFTALYTNGALANPVGAEAPYMPVWFFDSGTSVALDTICRWTWNMNGAIERIQSTGATPEDSFNLETDRSTVRTDTPLTVSVIYEWEDIAASGTLLIDNALISCQFFELALYGQTTDGTDAMLAKTSGSLGNIAGLTAFTPVNIAGGGGPTVTLRAGAQKLCVLRDISFADMDWKAPYLVGSFDHVANGVLPDGTRLTHATFTLIHRPGSTLVGLHSGAGGGTPGNAAVEAAYGVLKILGAEISWFDDGCQD